MRNVGQYLQDGIRSRQLLAKDVAATCGYNVSYFCRLLKNENMGIDVFLKICEAADINPINYFTGGAPEGHYNDASFTSIASDPGEVSDSERAALKALVENQNLLIKEKERLIQVLLRRDESETNGQQD